jgi:hypothetical protein
MTFNPIKHPAPDQSQWRHVVGKQCQTDWKHPKSKYRQKPENAANREK